jgi:hypothetical protein
MADDLFRTAPKEVVDYFDRRGLKPSGRWTDFAPHEHALGFTVARTAGYDVLQDLRDAVRGAVVDRVPFDQFKAALEPVLREKGWWGTIRRDGQTIQLGSTRRLQTIYWANVRSAQAAGEWARTQSTKDFLPYLTYKVSLSERRRKEHESWVGTTLPVDDAWWRTHYPPNGWNCKCRVEQISGPAADLIKGAKREAPPLDLRQVRDRSTGRVQNVPAGIDPGWQRNPGVTRERVAAILEADKLGRLPHLVRSTAIADHRATPVFKRTVSDWAGTGKRLPREGRSEALAREARRLEPIASIPPQIETALGGRATVLHISAEDGQKIASEHRVLAADADRVIEKLLDEGIVERSKGNWQIAMRVNGQPWLLIIKRTADGVLLANSLHRIDPSTLAAIEARMDRRP